MVGQRLMVVARRAGLTGCAGVLVLLTGVGLFLGYANKARCVGPVFDDEGRSIPAVAATRADQSRRWNRDVCYTDIQKLWSTRDLSYQEFPYVNGEITEQGKLAGGTVEYPVLTGFLMWFASLFADNDAQFLASTMLLMAPFGLATGWLLGKLARWRALIWAIGPPMILYAGHNWDLPVVACAVGAVGAMHLGSSPNWPVPRRAFWAAVLLGFGIVFKLYPGAFLVPLALYVLTRGENGTDNSLGWRSRYDWRSTLNTLVTAAVTVVCLNIPFAVVGFQGWLASITFQQNRVLDSGTNSIWFWGLRRLFGNDPVWQTWTNLLSPPLVLLSFALACWLGWRRYRRDGVYPWVQVSGAMLCGFLLLHKVHSPQYALWLVPFFVLLRVRWWWIASYLVCDAAISYGFFRLVYLHMFNSPYSERILTRQILMLGVWGRPALLVVLFFLFLGAATAFRTSPDPDGPDDLDGPDDPDGPAAGDDQDELSAPGEDRLLEVRDPGAATV
jgi:uncharacterized membrane protein